MHDIRVIRENPDQFKAGLNAKRAKADVDAILRIDQERRAATKAAEAEAEARREPD